MRDNESAGGIAAPFAAPSFRWLFGGSLVSMLGDQFTLIALPWLVLKMTNDSFMLGVVLGLTGVPRALFMLIGGAVVDRYSAKRVLMLSKYINTILLGLMGILVFSGRLGLPMVCVFALATGLSTAFSIPSGSSILPQVVPAHQLRSATGVMMMTRQFSTFAGPLLAGALIALSDHPGEMQAGDARGLGLAFLFDAFSYAFSAWTLQRVTVNDVAPDARGQSVWQSIGEGLSYCWRDRSMRTCFFYWTAVTCLVSGPIQVAIPVLARTLDNSATAFGSMMGAYGAGSLVGMLVSGLKPRLRLLNFGITLMVIDGIVGALFMPMGLIRYVWQGLPVLLAIGALSGFMQVLVFSWMQARAPLAMQGRAMSVFLFIVIGMTQVSAALTGLLMRSIEPRLLFAGGGALLIAIVAIAWAGSNMKAVPDFQAAPGPGGDA